MADLISKESKKFQCYSERGILSYYIFRYLPHKENFKKFLGKLKFPDGVKNPFEGVSITEESFFSELDLGKEGFGSPDGAIYFKANGKACLIFIEGKFNASYQESCSGKGKSYNSTIQGQLELRWRVVNNSEKIGVDEVDEDGNKVMCLKETENSRRSYKKEDPFYDEKKKRMEADKKMRAFRRVKLINGVGDFFKNFVNTCEIENIYFLAITKDKENPFNKKEFEEKFAPRLFKDGEDEDKWKEFKSKFCWLPSEEVKESDLN